MLIIIPQKKPPKKISMFRMEAETLGSVLGASMPDRIKKNPSPSIDQTMIFLRPGGKVICCLGGRGSAKLE